MSTTCTCPKNNGDGPNISILYNGTDIELQKCSYCLSNEALRGPRGCRGRTGEVGPTGSSGNIGLIGPTGTFGGTLFESIIPFQDNVVSLGSFSKKFKTIHADTIYAEENTIFLGNVPIKATNNTVELPPGTTVGGVPIGTLRILGVYVSISQVPTNPSEPYLTGDTFIIKPDDEDGFL